MKIGIATKIAAFSLLVAATPLAAQEVVSQVRILERPHFFIAVIGGVILAIGFQILLTSLSVASGISLVGDIEKKAEKRAHEHDREHLKELDKEPRKEWEYQQATVRTQEAERDVEGREIKAEVVTSDEDEDETSTIVKLSGAIGAWTVITASLSLFFASLLAVRLTVVGTVWMGITLGLIIWAAFFATMTYLELRSVSTLIGGVFTAALSGLRGSFAAAKGVFGSSAEDRLAKLGEQSITALREELTGAINPQAILQKLDEYVDRLSPEPLDYDRIKQDLVDLLKNVHVTEHSEVSEGHLDRETFFRMVDEEPTLKKEHAERIKGMYSEISSALKKEGTGMEKAEAAIGKMAPGGEASVQHTRAKIEEYLRQTGREELDPERIREDIERIFHDPKATKEILLNRIHAMDRSTLVSLLSQRDNMSEEKAEKLIGHVERAIDFVREKVMGMKSGAGELQESATGAAESGIGQLKAVPGKLEERVRQYLASVGRPEFDYDRLRLDFERMLHDPKASLKILRARMKLYDRDSLIALISSRPNTSEEDAERMVRKFEEAKDNVIRRAEMVENQVRERIRDAKRMAIHEAESVRKASATAAWWMVGTAVISGVFSALGATLAIIW